MSAAHATVSALVVQPDGRAEVRAIAPDLSTLKDIVGGWLEGVSYSIGSDWHAYVDEEGRLKGAPVNEGATRLAHALGWPGDFLVGPAVFLGTAPDGDEADVPASVMRAAQPLLGFDE